MSEKRPDDDRPAAFDWQSPRWREADEEQGDVERQHRLRDDAAPEARGAVDRGNSVGRSHDRRPRKGERPLPGATGEDGPPSTSPRRASRRKRAG